MSGGGRATRRGQGMARRRAATELRRCSTSTAGRLLLSPLLSPLPSPPTLARPRHPCCRCLSRWCRVRGSKSSRRMLRKEKNRGRHRQPLKRRILCCRAFKEEEICGSVSSAHNLAQEEYDMFIRPNTGEFKEEKQT